jgi:anti-sigma B factor antagonist
MIDQLRWSVCPGADGSTVVVLSGELDCAYEADVTRLLAGLDHGAPITVDVAGLTFLDSSGLRCLLHAAQEAAAHGSRLLVTNATGLVRRVIEIAAVEGELFGGVASRESAERPVAS